MSLLHKFFPFGEAINANKILDQRIKDIEDDIPESDIPSIVYEQEKELNNAALEHKKIIDDKAKSALSTIAITVALSTSMLSTFVNSRGSVLQLPAVGWIALFLSFLLLFHMASAAVLSLCEMQDRNKVYQFPLKTEAQASEEEKYMARYTRIANNYCNIIRNNLVSSSYRHIVLGLIFLGIVFLFVSASSLLHTGRQNINDMRLALEIQQELGSLRSNLSSAKSEIEFLLAEAAERDNRLAQIMIDIANLHCLLDKLKINSLP